MLPYFLLYGRPLVFSSLYSDKKSLSPHNHLKFNQQYSDVLVLSNYFKKKCKNNFFNKKIMYKKKLSWAVISYFSTPCHALTKKLFTPMINL